MAARRGAARGAGELPERPGEGLPDPSVRGECVPATPEVHARSEADVDESLIETFPASDPPSWVGLGRIGAPRRAEDTCPAAVPTYDEGTS
jgi:hypothetical protein